MAERERERGRETEKKYGIHMIAANAIKLVY